MFIKILQLIKNIIKVSRSKIKLTKMDYFVKKNLNKNLTKHYTSPSGKYNLTTEIYQTGPSTWSYSKGIAKNASGKLIAEVYRNYGDFWFSWIEDHPDGHDYLLCGEDYQGQTVIRLDTGERKDYLSADAIKGLGFCWASAEVSKDKLKLAVDGCFWGAPYEIIIVDFSNPLTSLQTIGFLDFQESIYEVVSWNDDNSISVGTVETRRKSDNKRAKELTLEEEKAMYDCNDYIDIEITQTLYPEIKNGDKNE